MNTTVDTKLMLHNKYGRFGSLALYDRELIKFIVNLQNIDEMTNEELKTIYDCNITFAKLSENDE